MIKYYEDLFIEKKIEFILKKYIKDVEEVCNNLIREINYSQNTNLKSKYDFFQYRANCKMMEFELGGISYRLHGKGCVAFSRDMFLDWEFGYRSRGCGISPWKVSLTLKKNNSIYTKYYDGNLIKMSCEQLVKKGIMFKQSNQYYFKVAENETFKPEFPIEYDTLIIEHLSSKWSMTRNKTIDRFIRKSTWVYNQIDKNEDKYILRFLLKGKEIYTIPYDDTGYPENAVKIMSDEILKHI